jgi:hypothetical protein
MERFNLSSLVAAALAVDEMINVRGGDGPVTPPVKKGEESDIIL